jgi:hypothetical protein
MGFYIVDKGRIEAAIPLLIQSTRLFRELGSDLVEVALNLSSFARAFALMGSVETATRLLSAVNSLIEEIGSATPAYLADLSE